MMDAGSMDDGRWPIDNHRGRDAPAPTARAFEVLSIGKGVGGSLR
jgi:hypothetical protein